MQQLEPPKTSKNSQQTEKLKSWLEEKLSTKQKNRRGLIWLIALLILCTCGSVVFFQLQMHKVKKKEKILRTTMNKLKYKAIAADCLGKVPTPEKLTNIPFGEDSGLILGVTPIDIRNVHAPHNPSLIASESGYHLFFRYDVTSSKAKYVPYHSHIGVVTLDRDFKQGNQEFKKIPIPSNYTEDPRVTKVKDQIYLTFNMLDEENLRCRCMTLANINEKTFDVNYMTVLDMNLQWIEKNWGSFEYTPKDKEPELIFEYQISPRTLFSLPDPTKNELKYLPLPREVAYCSFSWPNKWGQIRGGTPAQKIGDEYLAFFHSAFTEKKGLVWYVMGAYTFKAEPPFTITRMSPYPILFRGIFDAPIANTAQNWKRVIFPSGFVVEKQQDRELIHLACGENDCAVKIVTFDKKALLDSLVKFDVE
ncbi:MAG: hypothetical protein Q8L98_05125 [Chlamydiales bacterium]|nr:hypothetical protein [Chlamydiales bacterium]